MNPDPSPRGDSALPSVRHLAQRLRTLRQLAAIQWGLALTLDTPPQRGDIEFDLTPGTSWYDIPVTEFLDLLDDPDGLADFDADELDPEDLEAFQARLAAEWNPAQFGPIEPNHQAEAVEDFPFPFEPSADLAARIKAHMMKGGA